MNDWVKDKPASCSDPDVSTARHPLPQIIIWGRKHLLGCTSFFYGI